MIHATGTGAGRGEGSRGPGKTGSSKPALRDRTATSCGECRRRKQRCNQGQPCSNCARRFPPPICEYRPHVSSYRVRSALSNSPVPSPPPTLPGDIPMTGMNEPLLSFPGQTLQVPAAAGYGHAPSLDEARWLGVAITTPYPGAASPSPGAVGTEASPWDPVWTSHEQMPVQTGSSFASSPVGSSIAFSPSSMTAAEASSMGHDHMMGAHSHSHMHDASSMVIPQQYLGRGEPSSSSLPVDPHEQLSFPWGMGDQMQWPNTSTPQAPMTDISSVPVAQTTLNGELVHIFVSLISRFKASLDGNPDPSNPYVKHFVPWCLSSPLLSHVALYTSACFLTKINRLDHTVTLSLKGQAIAMLNDLLADGSNGSSSDEAIAAVMQLLLDEWYWGERHHLTAHLKELRDMISLRGGVGALGLNGLLGKLVSSTDRVISLSMESQPFLPSPISPLTTGDMTSAPFRVPHNTPLLPGQVTFGACADALDLHPVTASILDDVRFLIDTALKLPNHPTEQESTKLKTTARWIHNRISSLPPLSPTVPDSTTPNTDPSQHPAPTQSQQNLLHQTIRLTSLLYTTAILRRHPLSQVCTPLQFTDIWTTASRVPLTAWKGMLGVFLWLSLAVAPTAAKANQPPDIIISSSAHLVDTMLTFACTQLAIENWDIAERALHRMRMLQTWLLAGVGAVVGGGGEGQRQHQEGKGKGKEEEEEGGDRTGGVDEVGGE